EAVLSEAQADAVAKRGVIALELIDAGGEPRRKLRHGAPAGTVVKLTLAAAGALYQSDGEVHREQPAPASETDVTFTSQGAKGGGKAMRASRSCDASSISSARETA